MAGAATRGGNVAVAEAESSLLRGDSRRAGVGVVGCGSEMLPVPRSKLLRRLAVAKERWSGRTTAAQCYGAAEQNKAAEARVWGRLRWRDATQGGRGCV
jgi:hypothetical protein